MSKNKFLAIFLAITALVLIPSTTKAFSVKSGESIFNPKDQIIEGNLYAAGSTITIEGQVAGDVICAAQTVNISAKVDGDVICAAQTINITGEVLGNVRVAGNFINLSGTVGRNMNAFGNSIILSDTAKIGWDLLVVSARTEMRGEINGNLHGSASDLLVAGRIAKNLDIKIDDNLENKDKGSLEITDTGSVEGNVVYTGISDAKLVKDRISGQITHNLPESSTNKVFLAYLYSRVYAIFSCLLIGLVLLLLWRKKIINITDKMQHNIGANIGVGAILMFLPPIAALILIFTLIGIPLALIVTALWLMAILVGRVIFGVMVGRFILKKTVHRQTPKLFVEMIIGVVACSVVFSIPFLGWLGAMVGTSWVLGAMWFYYKKK
ncbi:MAG: polymer-forming cytoskeletal protein [Candidatus Falkowbacteria bacterium]